MKPLSFETWSTLAAEHRTRAQAWTLPYRRRRASGKMHPVHDFLFIYYRNPPSQLEAWHPGYGIFLQSKDNEPSFSPKYYSRTNQGIFLDPSKMETATHHRLEMALALCRAVQERPARFGCFGMHEWAMVYRGDKEGEVRHREKLPLRVPQETINTFVRSRPICCSHYDAFRFFTPSAKNFNRIRPEKQTRIHNEQGGCLHTNMDLYKLAAQCMPWVGSHLLWQSFQMAAEARILDMEASPYDCQSLGLHSIAVETSTGRTLYEERQQALAERAKPIRQSLIDSLQHLLQPAECK